ncbi:Transcription termination/antitermination protein NusA [bacterium HR29]|jgi:N utilization substance protein A|nr:Transcription termination/antitermination protein NusA [bacterium HR29]
MKNEFLLAISQLAAEKNLPKEVVIEAVEAALAAAYRRDGENAPNLYVKIDPDTGEIHAYQQRVVVEEVTDPQVEISVADARRYKRDAKPGDILDFEMKLPQNAGRIAAQTAKQVVLQRLREAEREAIYEEYAGKEGELVVGTVQRIDPRQALLLIGRGTEAVLPASEQVRNEHLRPGQRVKVVILEVLRSAKGPQIIVSRAHRNLLRRLFEMEVPEIANGLVEIKSIAREAGYRSKVAVHARDASIDPIGACVGLRGTRIQNIVNELNGERIDVIKWDPNPANFVANALSPAQVLDVEVHPHERRAVVIVPDKMLSLAIGKEGQNARLAAKLTGWRIDIHSQSAVERAAAGTAPEAPSTFVPYQPGEEPDIDLVAEEAPAAPTAPAPATPAVERPATAAEAAPVPEAPAPPSEPEPEEEFSFAAAIAEMEVPDREERESEEYGIEEFEEEEEEYEIPVAIVEEERPKALRFAEEILPRIEEEETAKKAKKKRKGPRPRLEEDFDEMEEIDYHGRIH